MNDRELDEFYRRASAADDARPRPAVRQAILEQAARSAHELGAQRFARASSRTVRPVHARADRRRRVGWRWQAVVPVAAALAVAAILVPTSKLPAPPDLHVSNTRPSAQQPIAPSREAQRDFQLDNTPASALAPSSAPPRAFPKQESSGKPAHAQSPPPAPSAQLAEQALQAPRSGSHRTAPPLRVPDAVPATSDNAINLPAEAPAAGGLSARSPSLPALGPEPPTTNPSIVQDSRSLASGAAAGTASGSAARSAVEARRSALAGETSDPLTEIQRVASVGDAEQLSALIARYPALLNAPDPQGRTPLMIGVLSHQSATVRLLLERGADPNVADRLGRTPLEVAQAQGDVAMSTAIAAAGGRLPRQ